MAKRRDPNQSFLFGPEPDSDPPGAPPAGPPRPAAVDPAHAALAAFLPDTLRLGTSSWSFPGWRGIVYQDDVPQARLAREGLPAYAAHPLLRSVSLDRAFYAPLPEAEYRRLAAQVPAGFRFLVKAFQGITRPQIDTPAAAPSAAESATFLDPAAARELVVGPAVMGLADACGPIVFQFSPMRFPRRAEESRFLDRLGAFLAALPRGPLYAVELRNAELLAPLHLDRYLAALACADACHSYVVHPTMPPAQRQRELVDPARFPAFVSRWLLHDGLTYDGAKDRHAPFNRLIDEDPATRADLAAMVADALWSHKAAWVLVNNKAEGSAPLSVFRLGAEIAARLRQTKDAGAA